MLTRLRCWLFGKTQRELLEEQYQQSITNLNNQLADELFKHAFIQMVTETKRKPGRPKGSKNKKRKIAV